MDVICPACGTEVSEWAANCPTCGCAIGAGPDPPVGGDDVDDVADVMARRRRWLPTVAIALWAAIIAGTAGGVAWRTWGHHGAATTDARLPADLANRQVFYAQPDQTLIVRGDGRIVGSFPPDLEGAGFPERPLIAADRTAVFIHGRRAYRAAPGSNQVQPVGPADRLIPSAGLEVGLVVNGVGSEPSTVRYVGVAGRPATAPEALPRDSTAVARLVTGLLVLSGEGHLHFAGGARSLNLGPVDSIMGTFVATVAWTARDGCSPFPALTGCPLHITETGSGADRTVAPPPGYRGFAGGGSFSPDGSHLAAFVFNSSTTNPTVRPVLITTRTGEMQVLGPVVPAGEPIGSAAWSPDGHWLFFCGLSGPLYAQPVGRHGGTGPAIALPLPASYAFVPL